MKQLEEHTVKFYERDDGKLIAKMEDPPVEGHGDDLAEALDDLQYEIIQFGAGVHEAMEDVLESELEKLSDD